MTLSRQHSVLKYAPVEGSARLLLLIIALHANDEGLCWPSTGLLAIETRLTRRRVQQLLREFESAGYIRLVVGDKRGKISQIYIRDFGAEEGTATASDSEAKAVKHGHRRRTRVPKRHASGAPDIAASTPADEFRQHNLAKPSEHSEALVTLEVAKSVASDGVKVAKPSAPFDAQSIAEVAKSGSPESVKIAKSSALAAVQDTLEVAKSGASESTKVAKSSAQIAKPRVQAVAKSDAPDCEILSHTRVERQVLQSNDPKDNTYKDIEKASSATKSQQECEISSQASHSEIEAPEAEPVTTRLQFSMERAQIRKVEREEKTRRAIMGTLDEDIDALLPAALDEHIEPNDVADFGSDAQWGKTDAGTPFQRPSTAGIPSTALAGAVGKVIGGVARAREAAQEEAQARYLRVVAWVLGYDLVGISDAQRETLLQTMEYLTTNNYREEDVRRFWREVWVKGARWIQQRVHPMPRELCLEIFASTEMSTVSEHLSTVGDTESAT